jgi:hypothetical protein
MSHARGKNKIQHLLQSKQESLFSHQRLVVRVGNVAQKVECLPHKHKASHTKKRRKDMNRHFSKEDI